MVDVGGGWTKRRVRCVTLLSVGLGKAMQKRQWAQRGNKGRE